MDEAQVVERVALIAHDQTAEVAEPGEKPLTNAADYYTTATALGARSRPRTTRTAPGCYHGAGGVYK